MKIIKSIEIFDINRKTNLISFQKCQKESLKHRFEKIKMCVEFRIQLWYVSNVSELMVFS